MSKILIISILKSYTSIKYYTLLLVISMVLGVFNCFSQNMDSLLYVADSLYMANNYALANKTYMDIYKIAKANNDCKKIARIERNIGTCYYHYHDKKNALNWFYQYLNTTKTCNLDSLKSDAYYTVGAIYIEYENLDSVKKYIYPAVELMKKEKNYSRLSRTYSILAELHINKTKDINKIEHYLKLAEAYADTSKNISAIAFAATKYYNYYFRVKKDYEKALIYINKVEKTLKELGDREALTNAYRGKAECLIMLRDTLALKYISKWFYYKDSIFYLQKAQEIAKYEEMYETEKKEAEIKQLQNEKQISQLEIANRKRTIYVLALILLLLVFFTLWWINRSNIKKKQQQLELIQKSQKEKERIARDLHDNVGGQLSYLITNLEWLANHPEKIKNEDELKKLLLNYSATGRNAILTLRETIWAVNNEKLSIIDFADRFKNYVLKLQIKNNVKIDFIENFKKPENILMPEQALNIFRICQEAFHNALKHSKANQINILFESSDKCLFKFTVEDNGIGFDYDKRYKDGHYGMKNMEERAKEANAEIEIISSINNGTKISICVKYLNANEVLQ